MAGILTEKECILLIGQLILNVMDGIITKENSLGNIKEDINIYASLGYMQSTYATRLKQMAESERAIAESIYNQIQQELNS